MLTWWLFSYGIGLFTLIDQRSLLAFLLSAQRNGGCSLVYMFCRPASKFSQDVKEELISSSRLTAGSVQVYASFNLSRETPDIFQWHHDYLGGKVLLLSPSSSSSLSSRAEQRSNSPRGHMKDVPVMSPNDAALLPTPTCCTSSRSGVKDSPVLKKMLAVFPYRHESHACFFRAPLFHPLSPYINLLSPPV